MSIAGVPRACHRVGRSSQARARRRGQLYTVSNPPPTHLSIGVKLSKLTEPLLSEPFGRSGHSLMQLHSGPVTVHTDAPNALAGLDKLKVANDPRQVVSYSLNPLDDGSAEIDLTRADGVVLRGAFKVGWWWEFQDEYDATVNEGTQSLPDLSIVSAGAGQDFFLGGAGQDIVDGGDDDDRIDGAGGLDTLSGGDDFIGGGDGDDTLSGNVSHAMVCGILATQRHIRPTYGNLR